MNLEQVLDTNWKKLAFLIAVILIITGIILLLKGREEENHDNQLVGDWHSTSWNYTINFNEDQTYTSNFVGDGKWNTNGTELVLNNNTYEYEFVGKKLHLVSIHIFFEKED